MAFIRIQKVNGRYYASKVHSFRNEQGKVRQNTLESYGRVDCSFIRRFFRRGPTQADVDRAATAAGGKNAKGGWSSRSPTARHAVFIEQIR